MKKVLFFLVCLQLISCYKKKLIEVVEVPLPSKDQKIEIGSPDDVKAKEGTFSLQKIDFKYNALDPAIDALTLETLYSRFYLNYTNNLNSIINGTEQENSSIEDILKKIDLNNPDLRNNAGGYFNETLFFSTISPKSGGVPKDTLAGAINKEFESFENFKVKFSDVASKQFGSGWAWLVVDKTGKLVITSTSNQDNPLMPKQPVSGTPILGIDVWEHAYFLNHRNQRRKYIDSFYTIIDWKKVGDKYEETLK